MQETASREKILRNVRKALIHKSTDTSLHSEIDFNKGIYAYSDPDRSEMDITFARQFTEVSGKFVFCENENEFIDNLKRLVNETKWENLFCLENYIKELLNKGEISYSDDAGLPESQKSDPEISASAPEQADKIIAGITFCEFLIARTGSILISSKQTSGRRLAVFPDVHIVLAYTSQLVQDVKDALQGIRDKYGDQLPSMITTITGPSRTADIEKTLIIGAHGPKEVCVFLVDDNK
ncbi:MAG: LUD domain-containing protein [Bacteroidota bacterium]